MNLDAKFRLHRQQGMKGIVVVAGRRHHQRTIRIKTKAARLPTIIIATDAIVSIASCSIPVYAIQMASP